MTNQELHEQLTAQLKSFYNPAMEADEFLALLSKRRMGKFSSIFSAESGFKCSANRFLPYMEELVDDQAALPKPEEAGFEEAITKLLMKFKEMHLLLAHFSEQLKEQNAEDDAEPEVRY